MQVLNSRLSEPTPAKAHLPQPTNLSQKD